LSQPFSYPLSVNAQKVLRLLQSSDFIEASRVKIDGELAREIESVISSYLKYLLEREVKSAVWLDTLRQQRLQFNHKGI
jgi:hypothetical protein